MHPRLYRLIEKHQRIDEALRAAQRRQKPDWIEILRLKTLKFKARELIQHFARRSLRT